MRFLIIVLAWSFSICEGQQQVVRNFLNAEHILEEGIKEVGNDVLHGDFSGAMKDVADTVQHEEESIFEDAKKEDAKWCGTGNTGDEAVDKCCKEHDKCPQILKASETKNGLKNTFSHPLYNCACDRKFYQCNKHAKSTTSFSIGFNYFNVRRPKCFTYDYPIIKCVKFGSSKNKEKDCQSYETDKSKSKIWQFADAWDWNLSH